MQEIKLTQGYIALVDDDDYEYLNQFKWYAAKQASGFYAQRYYKRINGIKRTIPMHRVIMNTPEGMRVDHIDHYTLNNQKSNLRNCTRSQNARNRLKQQKESSSKYKGVSIHIGRCKRMNKLGNIKIYYAKPKFMATIQVNNKIIRLGRFESEINAAIAYNNAALKYHGEFVNLNVINF